MSFTPVARIRSPGEAALALVQSEYPTYHPLIALARMAHDKKVLADPKLELEVHRTILPYVSPKLANAEVPPTPPEGRRVVVSLFEERVLEDGTSIDVEVPLVRELTGDDASPVVPLDR